ncbi:MAG: hypothetical protein ACPGN3_08770 [Opitutales bacterium]
MNLSIKDALLIVNGRAQEIESDSVPAIASALLALDTLLENLSEQIPGQLTHYLERRSYQKALDYVETHSINL